MNIGINMNTPERVEMAKAAKSIQQRAEIWALKSLVNEGALLRETPDELRARWDLHGGYKAEWCKRYRAARRRLTGLGYEVVYGGEWRRNYADGLM